MIDFIITLFFQTNVNSTELKISEKEIKTQNLHESSSRPKVLSLYQRKLNIFNRKTQNLKNFKSPQNQKNILKFKTKKVYVLGKSAQIKPSQKNIFEISPSNSKRKNFRKKTKSPKFQKNKTWNGHFAATNFNSKDAQLELKEMKKTLTSAIKSLPPEHLSSLKNLEVKNKYHASRGMANANRMIINTGLIDSQKELNAIFIHEMGHVTDLGFLKSKGGKTTSFWDGKTPIYSQDKSLKFYRISWRNSQEQKSNAKPSDFISGYAQANVFEDFAETYIFYKLHGEKFRILIQSSKKLQEKYNFMKDFVFDGKEFQLEKNSDWQPKYIWDATLVE